MQQGILCRPPRSTPALFTSVCCPRGPRALVPQVSKSSGAPSETIAILEWAWSYTQVIEALLDELADGGADGPLDELDFDEFLAVV